MGLSIFDIGKDFLSSGVQSFFAKLYWNTKNYLKYRTTDMFKAVEIETISVCNRRCVYCPVRYYKRESKLMNEKLFKKIIDDLSKINFSGRISPHFYGEPLLDKRLPRLMKYVKRKLPECKIIIFTNGDFLNKETFHNLINSGVDKFLITQHGEKMSVNMSNLFKEVNWLQKRKYIHYRVYTMENTDLSNRGGLVDPTNMIKMKLCPLPSDIVVVDYNGHVILCCNDYFSQHVFGDTNKENLIDIWNKPIWKKVRHDLMTGKFDWEICKICVGLKPAPTNPPNYVAPIDKEFLQSIQSIK